MAMDRSVKAGFSSPYFPQSFQCFWSPCPTSTYPCASDYTTCRSNPLAQSCPSFARPLSHSQCQHSSNGQRLINKCLMVFPEEGRSFGVASCPTCQYCREQISCSAPACRAQSELGMPSYRSSPSILSDCFQHPSEYFDEPTTSEHQYMMKCGGTSSRLKPKKLLWLSEEEAEIIRLIRLSQVKDLSRCSSSYHASEQASPVLSARTGPEVQEEVNLNEVRNPTLFSSRVSSSSLEESASRAPEAVILNLGFTDSKLLLSEEEGPAIYVDSEAVVVDNMETTNQVVGQKQRAASCIQYFWRKHMERKTKDLAEEKRLEALKFIFEMPASLEHLLQTAVMAMKSGQLLSWHASIQRSALVIQHAWKKAFRIKQERKLVPKTLPQDLKELYKLILSRNTSKGITPPSLEKFLKLMERLQAMTEGARIRRRLKSRRLQTIVREIKEIRVVLQDLSGEAGLEPSLNLRPQLTMQLQQKLLQLQTALSGPQDAARVLLRRCPATPLVLCSSKNVQVEHTALQSSSIGDSGSLKMSNEGPSSAQKPGATGHNLDKFSTESFTGSQKLKQRLQPKSTSVSVAGHNGDFVSSLEADGQQQTLSATQGILVKAENAEKQTVPKIERLRQRGRYEANIQAEKELVTACPTDLVLKNGSSENAVEETESTSDQWQNSTFSSFQEFSSVKSSSLNMDDSDSEDRSQNLDIPKHPFLRRKSKAMPPQKLDWSKVKPMVSSRLEPELKTRLLKAKFRGTALFRKRNFSQIKSRLFNYENSGFEENDDSISALFRHNVAEGSINNRRKQLSLQVQSEGQPGVMNMPSSNSKSHSSKRPSLRYSHKEDKKSIIKEAADADFHANLVSFSLQKVKREKASDVSAFVPSCKENECVAVENQTNSQIHSKRYDSTRISPDVWVSEASRDSASNCGNTQQMRKGDVCFSKHAEEPLSELEKMFAHVINEQGGEVTLMAYFGVDQQDSVVPRLYPNSSVFQCSRHKMTQIHQLLSKEGRAGRLQHNCLSFVSIRD